MKLGRDITLWGLELGLMSMARGEVARFWFSPRYAYGPRGCPPHIPPDTTVLFHVELLDFIDSEECDLFFELSDAQKDTFPLEKVLKVAATEKEFGNYFFHKQNFGVAKHRYKRALSILDRSCSSEAERSQINTSKVPLLLNLSLTYLKLECPERALKYGKKALEMDQGNVKALFRCGQACLCMREYNKSRDFLTRAQQIQPFNRDINNELKKWARCYQEYVETEKDMCCRMFDSSCG
ncbi:inactive peptidyl-prolyl cis-trans isomerase FKBP6 [Manacus candei]|uniref:inactive peptidyl-prolyl cis-trans isomerase FKBP6 n=1 Tax=Manacus candei TaxID=415023 RepID=UPI002225C322|nr:inactive peptidyl-prolyl cis-trans isomerase FKBP6 [Manacus candei]